MALPVECVAVIGDPAIKALDREIQRCAVWNLGDNHLTFHRFLQK